MIIIHNRNALFSAAFSRRTVLRTENDWGFAVPQPFSEIFHAAAAKRHEVRLRRSIRPANRHQNLLRQWIWLIFPSCGGISVSSVGKAATHCGKVAGESRLPSYIFQSGRIAEKSPPQF